MQIQTGFDASGAVAAAQNFAASLGIARDAIENMVVSQVKFNKSAEDGKWLAVVKGIIDSNRQLVISLQKVGEQWEATAAKVDTSAKKVKDATNKINTPANVGRGQAVVLLKEIAEAYGITETKIRNLIVEEGRLKAVRQGTAYVTQVRAQIDATRELVLTVQRLGNEYKVLNSRINNIAPPRLPTRADLYGIPPSGGGGGGGGKGGKGGKDDSFLPFDPTTVASVLLFKQALTAITSEIRNAAAESREFATSISQIRTLSQEAQSTFKQWDSTIMRVSDNTGLSAIDVASAAYEALSNQITSTSAQTERFMSVAGEFARTTKSTLTQSVDLLSSAINGYGMTAERAEEISAKFFKTIDLGRVKAGDMANTFGRIAPLANQLGIEFEESLAAISVLTRQGVLPQYALTFFLNLMQKLVSPTEDLKKLFEEWGTGTAEASIATFGFVGVLEKLEQASKGSATEVSRLFNEIRGKQGFIGLTQNGFFQQYKKDLSEIINSSDSYANAIQIRAESAADTVNKEFNKIHNMFLKFGEDFTKALAFFNNNIGTLSGTVRVLANSVVFGAVGYGAWVVGSKAASIASLALGRSIMLQSGEIVKNTGATMANIGAKGKMAAILGTLGGPTGLLLLAAGGFALLREHFRESKKEIEGVSEAMDRLRDEFNKQSFKLVETQDQKNIARVQDVLKNLYQQRLKGIAGQVQEVQKGLEGIKTKGTEVNDELQGGFKNFLDALTRGIGDFKTKIADAKNAIKNSAKELLGFRETLDDIVRQTQLKYADKFQKNLIRDQFIDQLRSQADALYATGRVEDRAVADQKLAEAARLYQESFDLWQEGRKEQREQQIAEGTVPPDQNRVIVSTEEMRRFFADLQAQQEAGHKRTNKALEDQIKNNEKLIDQEEARRKRIEEIGKELNNLSIITKDNRIKPEFADPTTGKFDQKKFDAFRNRLLERMKAEAKTGEADEYFRQLDVQADHLKIETKLRLQLIDLQEKQNNLRREEVETVRQYNEAITTTRRSQEAILGSQGKLGDLAGKLAVTQQVVESYVGEVFSRTNQSSFKQPERRKLVDELNSIRTDLENAIQVYKAKPLELINDKDISNLEEKGKLYFKKYREFFKKAIEAEGKQMTGDLVIVPAKKPGDRPIGLGDIEGLFNQNIQETKKEMQNIKKSEQILKETDAFTFNSEQVLNLQKMGVELKELEKFIIPPLASNFDYIKNSLGAIVGNLGTMAQQIRQMPQLNIGGGDNLGGPIEYKASGGIIGLHPGRPKGTDTQPAWLTPGEFIMPVAQTQRFLPQLKAMLHNRPPMYFNQGGHVSTNVGDIHITVSGNNTPEKNVREIAYKLRREVRRGNVKLS